MSVALNPPETSLPALLVFTINICPVCNRSKIDTGINCTIFDEPCEEYDNLVICHFVRGNEHSMFCAAALYALRRERWKLVQSRHGDAQADTGEFSMVRSRYHLISEYYDCRFGDC